MNITNKSKRPISIPLPGGKKLFLGPGKSGQINAKAAELPHVAKLVEAGDLELDEVDRKQGDRASDPTVIRSGTSGGSQKSNIRRTGDR